MRPSRLLFLATCLPALVPAGAVAYEESLYIDGGRPVTASPDVRVTLAGPADAHHALVSADPGLRGAVRLPARGEGVARLDPSRPDGVQRLFVRYFTEAGEPLPASDSSDGIVLDRTPPSAAGLRLVVADRHLVCRRGGPAVAGTSASRVRSRVAGRIRDRAGGIAVRFAARRSRPGPWRPRRQSRVASAPAAAIWAQLRDGVGNVGPWRRLRAPGTATARVLRPAGRPYTWARHCATRGPRAEIRRVNRLWRASGRRRPADRARVRPPGSSLVWTQYARQGLYPNWVHATTALNGLPGRPSHRRVHRAGMAEILAASRVDRSAGGRVFRVNENHFRTPDDHKTPPWRDAMGSALILAHLPRAVSTGDGREQALALDYAREYLAAFSVDHSEGGLRWSGARPGSWYLEYTYRTRSRVLNGFMQSLVSLHRFHQQARRLARRDTRWTPLSSRARRLTVDGARALHHWLPDYDLGSGRTRYSLRSGPASEEYRSFHVTLLSKLAAIDYLPAAWRARHRRFASRWSAG